MTIKEALLMTETQKLVTRNNNLAYINSVLIDGINGNLIGGDDGDDLSTINAGVYKVPVAENSLGTPYKYGDGTSRVNLFEGIAIIDDNVGNLGVRTISNLTSSGEVLIISITLSTKACSTVSYSLADYEAMKLSKEDVSNKVTSLLQSSTDSQFPSAKAVYKNLTGTAFEVTGNGSIMLILNGQTYYQTPGGKNLCGYFYDGTYTQALLVTTSTASSYIGRSGYFVSTATEFTYDGRTYYYASGLGRDGNYTDTSGLNRYKCTATTASDAAIELLDNYFSAINRMPNGFITTDRLNNGAVTSEKLASAVVSDINGKEVLTNKVTAFSATPTDTKYPTEKLVKDKLDLKANITSLRQAPTLIKTVTVSAANIAEVEITLDTNSSAFLLKHNMTVYIDCSIDTSNKIGYILLNNKYTGYVSITSTAEARYARVSLRWNGFRWENYSVYSAVPANQGYVSSSPKYVADEASVTSVKIATVNGTTYFPVGTVITVLGENYYGL